jgi:hypothetical protein
MDLLIRNLLFYLLFLHQKSKLTLLVFLPSFSWKCKEGVNLNRFSMWLDFFHRFGILWILYVFWKWIAHRVLGIPYLERLINKSEGGKPPPEDIILIGNITKKKVLILIFILYILLERNIRYSNVLHVENKPRSHLFLIKFIFLLRKKQQHLEPKINI